MTSQRIARLEQELSTLGAEPPMTNTQPTADPEPCVATTLHSGPARPGRPDPIECDHEAEAGRLRAELEQARQQIAEVRDVCDQIDLELSGTIPPDDTTYGGLVTRVRNAAGFHPAAAGRSTATTEHALWGQLADALNAISAWGIDPLRGLADRLGGRKIVRLDPGEVDHHSGWTYQLKYRPVIEVDGVTPYGWEVEHRPNTGPAPAAGSAG